MSTSKTFASGESDVYIGVDVGGTHTDVCVDIGQKVARGKALTTYEDFGRGVLQSIDVAAQTLDVRRSQLLGRTDLLVIATTVVTNTIVELSGAAVGVFVTSGFKDAFHFAGGQRKPVFDDHLQTTGPDLINRRCLAETDGRMDYLGRELIPLDTPQIEYQARRLVEQENVDTIAICFLNSYANPSHELQAEELIRDIYPHIFVSISCQMSRLHGENRRWFTAVLNSYVQPSAKVFLESLSSKLYAAGLRGTVAFFQGAGGGMTIDRALKFPLALLASGPAAGALDACSLARAMAARNVIIADMGGTSFDAGVLVDYEARVNKNVEIGPFRTQVNLVDVLSIGQGGGSIASISERGVPQVGPRSARSIPGPACYDQGGREPTVTDAMLVMGFLDPSNYLGGRVQIRKDLAIAALNDTFGTAFGWAPAEAAAAVHDLVVANMASVLREVTVQRGYDPRDFLCIAYGGTLPLVAWQIARAANVKEVVIPHNSSVFCAQGLLSSDFVIRLNQTVLWNLADTTEVARINTLADEMVATAVSELRAEGFSDSQIEVARSGDFRFVGQVYELTLSLPNRPLEPTDVPRLLDEFIQVYERKYGRGTAWQQLATMLVNCTVTASGRREHRLRKYGRASGYRPAATKGMRDVYLPSERDTARVPIYDGLRFTIGTKAEGPSIIDETDTTIFVPPGVMVVRDEFLSYRLRAVDTE